MPPAGRTGSLRTGVFISETKVGAHVCRRRRRAGSLRADVFTWVVSSMRALRREHLKQEHFTLRIRTGIECPDDETRPRSGRLGVHEAHGAPKESRVRMLRPARSGFSVSVQWSWRLKAPELTCCLPGFKVWRTTLRQGVRHVEYPSGQLRDPRRALEGGVSPLEACAAGALDRQEARSLLLRR